MNATTPRLRAHLLAELRDLGNKTATTEQLAGQVPHPRLPGRAAWREQVYPHLVALAKKGLVRKIKPYGVHYVLWQLVTS
jgi:hypothetical protein